MVEIRNRRQFEGWLKGKSPEVAVALAARSALRVLPVVRTARGGHDFYSTVMLPVFRATGVAWPAAEYPDQATKRRAAAAEATFAANNAATATAAAAPNAANANAIFAAADAALAAANAALAAANAATAATAAAATTANTAAATSNAIATTAWSALSDDATQFDAGGEASIVAASPLWPQGQPTELRDLWQKMKAGLLAEKQDWQVWTTWYEDRLAGRVRRQARELVYALIEEDQWKQGPAIVNAEIRRRIDEIDAKDLTPEPEPEPGPAMQVTARGLENHSQPLDGDFDDDRQKGLHDRLLRVTPTLADATRRVANAHPALNYVVSEYVDLVAQPFERLDVDSLWAVGAGLLAFRDAFKNPPGGAMTEPLEPAHLALLQQAAEIHGAFILGFPKGVELVERADRARLSPEMITQITAPSRSILDALSNARLFVEERTRKFIGAIEESLIVQGWEGARTAHAGYVVTRNSLIALGRFLNWGNSALSTVAGGYLLAKLDPGGALTDEIGRFMLVNARDILSFAEPFPELKVWFAALIDHLNEEKKT